MVEIEGERVLAASCIRKPAPDMKVRTASERAKGSRRMVMELLLADQPQRDVAHDPDSTLWRWADAQDLASSRFPVRGAPTPDRSHPALAVNPDACIHCNPFVRPSPQVPFHAVLALEIRSAAWWER